MASIVNLIDDNNSFLSSTYQTGTGLWTVQSNGTLQRTSKRSKTGMASLLITGTSNASTTTVLSHPASSAVAVTGGKKYRGLMWFHHETIGRAVKFGVQFYDSTRTALTYAATHYTTQTQGYGEWTLVYLNVDAPADAAYAALRIDLETVAVTTTGVDQYLWVDDAALVTYGTIDSRFLYYMAAWIPDWMIVDDYNQTNPQYPMMRFTELLGSQMDDVLDLIADFDYIPPAEGGPVGDTSSLVDPANYGDPTSGMTTKPEWLSWLAQLVGIRSTALDIQSSTSWNYLETTYTSWTAWENAINSASAAALSISSLSRTNGIVTLTTTTTHGLNVGDVVTIAGSTVTSATAADDDFNGYYEVTSASGTNLSYSQQYPILSMTQAGTTTVTVVCGRPHGFAVNNTVTISGASVASFNGTFTVASVSTSIDDGVDQFTYIAASSATATSYSGTAQPATNPSGTGGTATPADLKWSFIENASIASTDPAATLAEYIRTGASGVWSGTLEGMRRAARIPMTGTDLACTVNRTSGTLTVTTKSAHGFSVGDVVTIYAASDPSLNRPHGITAVTSTTFTAASGGKDLTGISAWVTNNAVTIDAGYWTGKIDTITVASNNTYTVTFATPIPATTLSGPFTIISSGSPNANAVHTPFGTPTVASDRLSVSFVSDQDTPTLSTTGGYLYTPINNSCFTVRTQPSQTPSSQTITDFVNIAKPAGGVVSQLDYSFNPLDLKPTLYLDSITGGVATPQVWPNLGTAGNVLDAQVGSVAYTGGAYIKNGALVLSGVTSNYATLPHFTPLGTPFSITGDIEMVFRCQPSTLSASRGYITKTGAYRVIAGATSGNDLQFGRWNGTSWSSINSTAGIVVAGVARWYRVRRVQSTGVVTFEWAADQSAEPTSWTSAGSGTVDAGTAIATSTNIVEIGSRDTGQGVFDGLFYQAIIRSGISGTVAANVNFTTQRDWTTSFSETSTNVAIVSIVSTNTTTNDPQYLPALPAGYAYIPGTSANVLSIPDPAQLAAATQLDLRLVLARDAWYPTATDVIAAQAQSLASPTDFAFALTWDTGARPGLWVSDGTTVNTGATSSLAAGIPNLGILALKTTYRASDGRVQYFTKATSPATCDADMASNTGWAQLGTDRTTVVLAGGLINSGQPFGMGGYSNGAAPMTGKIFCCQAATTIDGAPFFQMLSTNITSSTATSFTATSGQTVTVSRSGSGRKTSMVPARSLGGAGRWLFGTDDFALISDNELLDFGPNDSFTALVAVRTWATPSTGQRYVAKGNGGNPNTWLLYNNSTTQSAAWGLFGTSGNNVLGSPTSTAGASRIYVGVVDGATARAYLNGSANSTTITTTGGYANTGALRVGADPSGSAYADAEIYAVGVWRRALTAAEITSLSNYFATRML